MIDNIKTQMRKGILEYCVLSIISRRGEAYTSDVIEVLRDADLLVVEGTVYPLLTRMKNNGLLTYRWEESREGPPRKYFRLTPEGAALLADLEQEWNAITASIQKVVSS
ncbi:MAG: PadR family transcriptional regulator [Paludibacteraceae bacterium]